MSSTDDLYREALRVGRAGRLEEAVAMLRKASAAIADHSRAQGLLGTLLTMLDRPAEALPAFSRAAALDPGDPVIQSDMGIALSRLDQPAAALACFDQALALAPGDIAARNNRAGECLKLGDAAGALADADAVIAAAPGRMTARRLRVRALMALRRSQAALEAADDALALDGGAAETHGVRAAALEGLGRYDEAIASYERAAVLLRPGDHDDRFNLALALLRRGDFERGWPGYEGRAGLSEYGNAFARAGLTGIPALLHSRREDFVGARVLVVGEQGIGDEIMFASILPDLIEDAAHLSIVANPRLASLFHASFPSIDVLSEADGLDLAAFDKIVAIGGLGHAYRRRRQDFVGRPYLTPKPAITWAWRERLGPRRAPLRVGLSWRGGTAKTAAARSLALDELSPLLARSDCEFVSLQYGEVEAEVERANALAAHPIKLFPREDLMDFEQQAGLILALDLVVSVQTALVHLCGAVGAPCLAMLPFVAEWRYGERGRTMPWYGGVTLLRQPAPRDWSPVLGAVADTLDRRMPAPGLEG